MRCTYIIVGNRERPVSWCMLIMLNVLPNTAAEWILRFQLKDNQNGRWWLVAYWNASVTKWPFFLWSFFWLFEYIWLENCQPRKSSVISRGLYPRRESSVISRGLYPRTSSCTCRELYPRTCSCTCGYSFPYKRRVACQADGIWR